MEEKKKTGVRLTTLHPSLLYPLTIGGIERNLAILIFMVAGVMFEIFQSFIMKGLSILLGIGLYLFLKHFYKKDYFIFFIYIQYEKMKNKFRC